MEEGIKQSTDYLKFQRIEGNRPISRSHLKGLIDSISKKNLLHMRPIIVDEEFRVLDGQHRLEAARQCQLPVYYITCNSESFKEITQLNQNQKNWNLIDFLSFYSINFKNPNYIKIQTMMEQYSLSIEPLLLYIGFNIKKTSLRKTFCDGDFLFDYNENEIISKISDWNTLFDFMKTKNCEFLDFFKTIHFRKALVELLSSSKINKQQFWEKIKNGVTSFYRCPEKDSTLDMLLKIYNKQSPYIVKKEELHFH